MLPNALELPIKGYFVTIDGQVISKRSGKAMSPFKTMSRSGVEYLAVNLYENGKRKKCFIHRLVFRTYFEYIFGKIDDLYFKTHEVDHADYNTQNNNFYNLSMVSYEQNQARRRDRIDAYGEILEPLPEELFTPEELILIESR